MLRTERPEDVSAAHRIQEFAARPVLAIGAATVAVLLLFAARDGYHRDELYFLEASRHLALGYVDQPPLAILMAGLSRFLFGDSVFGLRLIPALLDGVTVVLAGHIAREMGGRRFAQTLASLMVAVGGYLIIAHIAGPSIYDLVFWTLISFLVIRILRTGDQRWWLVVGVVAGIALQAKDTILLLLGGLAVGLIVTGRASVLRYSWIWIGAAIALGIFAPNLVWQAAHHWPTLEMDRSLRAEHSGLGFAAKYPVLQVLVMGPILAPAWMAGLWALWREACFEPYRSFAVAFAVLFLLLWIVIPDRFYYLAPLYVVLFASGSIVTEDVVEGTRGFFRKRPRRGVLWRSRSAAVAIPIVSGAMLLPLALPVLTPVALGSVQLQNVNYNLGETIGWPEFVSQIAVVWRSLPAPERPSAVIVTSNYGEAGAIDEYGASNGLSNAYSGHNSYWWWGPPKPDRRVAVVVGLPRPALTPYFAKVSLAATLRNPWGVENDEEGQPVWVCTGQREPWSVIWPEFKHYG